MGLQVDHVLAILEEGGRLSQRFKHFEVRSGQRDILTKMVEAFNENAIALVEAGTGTGKSIAYLIPSLIAAVFRKERVVISTHTISLQEQILYKDLPVLLQALEIDVKAVLVKGMGNYVCLRKCDDIALEKKFLSQNEQEMLDQIESLAKENGRGARSDLPFNPPATLWEMVAAEHDTCNGTQCPYHMQCPYIKARKNSQDAQLLVVNHHLLFADLVLRAETNNYTAAAILPPYQRLIIDEAHHLEEIATGFFANRFSKWELYKTLSKVVPEKQGKLVGKLTLLKDKLNKKVPQGLSLPHPLPELMTLELPSLYANLLKELEHTFLYLEQFLEGQVRLTGLEESKLRLRAHHYALNFWKEKIAPTCLNLSHLLKRYALGLSSLVTHLEQWNEIELNESIKGILFDIKMIKTKLENEANRIEGFMEERQHKGKIRWLESNLTKRGANFVCTEAFLDVSQKIFQHLCRPFDTVAFLSATLSTRGTFEYIKERFGISQEALGDRHLIETSVDSPF